MPAEAPTIATALKAHGLRHRPVRQEPPRRPQRVPADGARLRRVLRLPLSPRRDGGPVPSQLPAGAARTRSARATWSTAGRPTRTTRPCSRAGARSASRRSRTPATLYPKRMETVDDEILDQRAQVHRQGQDGRQAVLRLAQPDAHARRHASLATSTRAMRNSGERLERCRKPAWRSSTTSSAR